MSGQRRFLRLKAEANEVFSHTASASLSLLHDAEPGRSNSESSQPHLIDVCARKARAQEMDGDDCPISDSDGLGFPTAQPATPGLHLGQAWQMLWQGSGWAGFWTLSPMAADLGQNQLVGADLGGRTFPGWDARSVWAADSRPSVLPGAFVTESNRVSATSIRQNRVVRHRKNQQRTTRQSGAGPGTPLGAGPLVAANIGARGYRGPAQLSVVAIVKIGIDFANWLATLNQYRLPERHFVAQDASSTPRSDQLI